jgi:hypothetical protein
VYTSRLTAYLHERWYEDSRGDGSCEGTLDWEWHYVWSTAVFPGCGHERSTKQTQSILMMIYMNGGSESRPQIGYGLPLSATLMLVVRFEHSIRIPSYGK